MPCETQRFKWTPDSCTGVRRVHHQLPFWGDDQMFLSLQDEIKKTEQKVEKND